MKLSDEELNKILVWITVEGLVYGPQVESVIQELKLARARLKFATPSCGKSACRWPKCVAQKAYEDFGKEVSDGNQAEGD